MSTFSEAYGNQHPLHLYNIVPLDYNSVQTVPDSHVWPESDDVEADDRLAIPTINLKDPDAAKLILQACETWGIFQVINHDIPLNLVDEVELEVRRLFSLPTQQKLKVLRSPDGATGYGLPKISPFFNKNMWYEGFTIIGNSASDHAKELWPHDYQRFCTVMDDYQKKMEDLAKTLMLLCLKSLDISEEETNWVFSQGARTALQLNSYPSCPDPNRAMGLAPHTDTSLLTILHQSTVSGLQIFKEEVGWVSVYPTSGAFVVNVGDLLHILSNARFPSVVHRVVMKESQQRFSVAFFHSLPTDFCISPLGLINSGQTPRYRSVPVGEFVGIKYKILYKALDSIRI